MIDLTRARSRRGGRPAAPAAIDDAQGLRPTPFGPAGPWVAHFEANLAAPRNISWDDPHTLDATERRAIGRSIAKFQLGESSDGRYLKRAADVHAGKSGDHAYSFACRLFIREQQRHGDELRRFMLAQGLATIERHWSDSIFRIIRKLGRLDTAISVLLTAELIALVYYQALARATRSATLRSACAEILRDERVHVVFQAGALGRIRADRPLSVTRIKLALQNALFAAAAIVVWLDHRTVFRAAGFGFGRYWRACWGAFESVAPLMLGRRPGATSRT